MDQVRLPKRISFFGEEGHGTYILRPYKEVPSYEFKYAVAIAVEMDYDAIQCSPSGPASTATGLAYSKMAFTAGLLAQYIRGLGFQAVPCGNDTACSIPIAIDA